MPDGLVAPDERTDLERAADEADAALVRRVRRNLVLWSGLTTLVILVVLAAALYFAAASSLANSGVAQLDARMGQIKSIASGQRPPAQSDEDDPYGFIFGQGSGTFAMIVDSSGNPIQRPNFRVPPGLPDPGAATAALTSGRDVRTCRSRAPRSASSASRSRTPRHHVPHPGRPGPDRRAADPLDVMLAVLVVGGLVVIVVAFGFGTVYARRALVPIRAIADHPARGAPPPARLRRRRQPRAADAAHGHPEQRRAPPAPSRRAGGRGRHRARRHRRRGRAHDRDRRGPAPPRAIRFRGCRARAPPRRPRRRRRRRVVRPGEAGRGPRRPRRGRPSPAW